MSRKPYPTPLTIKPLAAEHTHTFIVLHGMGSNAERFGRELLSSANLPGRLPTVKFVFPTARKRRSTVLKKIPINQWFDNYSLEDPGQRTDLQVEGLTETAEFLRGLITLEASILGEKGYQKIVLGGLSQGCAAGVFTLLGGGFGENGRETLGVFFGMSGWLPFEAQLNDILGFNSSDSRARDKNSLEGLEDSVQRVGVELSDEVESDDDGKDTGTDDDEDEDEDEDDIESSDDDDLSAPSCDEDEDFLDPFRKDDDCSDNITSGKNDSLSRTIQALNHIRDILDLPPFSAHEEDDEQNRGLDAKIPAANFAHLRTPVFLGHGSADPKVPVHLGEQMANLLSLKLRMDVTWKPYTGFGHWYKVPDEDDIIVFLQAKIGIPIGE
jgi:predicted esterase